MPAKKKLTDNPITRWRKPGFEGFENFLTEIQPMIPGDAGRFVPYTIPSDRVRSEIKAALDGKHHTVVFCWPRRHGKTVVSALIIVWRFLTRTGENIAIVSNSVRQTTDTAFRLIRTILEKTPYTLALIREGRIKVFSDRITFDDLDNTIQGFPNNAATLDGKRLTIAQKSELHAEISDEVFQVLASSTIDTEDGLVIVDSYVGPMSSPLWALYQLHEKKADPTLYFSHIEYQSIDDAIEYGPPWIRADRLRSRQAQMLPIKFDQLHLNKWSAGASNLFPPSILDKCRETYDLDAKAIAGERNHRVGAGLDRAFGFSLHGDATITTCVLKVLQDEAEHYYVLASDNIRFSSADGIKKKFNEYREKHGMSRAVLESYNVQDIASWAAEQPFEHEVVFATSERQANAFTALYNAAAEGRLHIHPLFTRLLHEMASFEYRLEVEGNKGSLPKFAHAKGAHDDTCYSLAWAIYSLRTEELHPYELPSVVCNARGPVVKLCVLNGGDHVPLCAKECRSFTMFNKMYQEFRKSNNIEEVSERDFLRMKVTNKGFHLVQR
ncbi:MAG: hypothetical protein ACPGO3_05480 [Magnetospiraceae bacterium]